MDQVRGEFDRLSLQSQEQRQGILKEKSLQLEVTSVIASKLLMILDRKLKLNGTLQLQSLINFPLKKVATCTCVAKRPWETRGNESLPTSTTVPFPLNLLAVHVVPWNSEIPSI